MHQKFRKPPPRLSEVFQSYDPAVYFVTFCTMYRRPLLANDKVQEMFLEYARRGMAEHGVVVGRYVIMPDHVHLFVCGGPNFTLGIWVKGLKRALAVAITEERLGTAATTPSARIWQPGFFDHLLRNAENYEQKWQYVKENPVRNGLVQRADDWPFQGEVVQIEHR
jgi:putative transposase